MALIKCPECGKEISNKAKNCVNCGYPIKEGDTEEKIKPTITNDKKDDKDFDTLMYKLEWIKSGKDKFKETNSHRYMETIMKANNMSFEPYDDIPNNKNDYDDYVEAEDLWYLKNRNQLKKIKLEHFTKLGIDEEEYTDFREWILICEDYLLKDEFERIKTEKGIPDETGEKNLYIFLKVALSKKEIKQLIKDKLLTSQIFNLASCKDDEDKYVNRNLDPLTAKKYGVRAILRYAFLHSDNYNCCTAFYFTDFYLIICFGKDVWHSHGCGANEYYDIPDEILVVPLSKIEYVKLEGDVRSYYNPGITVNESPIKGALVGGAIAGQTGAIVGAIANSGTKTILSGINYNNEYNLSIKLKDCDDIYSFERYIVCPVSWQTFMENLKTNVDLIEELLKRSNEKISIEEKQQIIQKTISEAKKEIEETESNSGCYVATCVYGSYDCPEVWTLRRYRDNILAETWYGRTFIHTYYAISPTVVKLFGNKSWFKKFWKNKLDKIVIKLQKKGFEKTPYIDKKW